jgi:PhnB protein
MPLRTYITQRSKTMHVSPYLSFKGNCEQAFKFYERVLGGKIEGIMTWGATPMAKEVPPDWQNKIIHARLVLDGQDVYGADAPPQYYQQPQGFSVSLGVKQVAEAERVFKA